MLSYNQVVLGKLCVTEEGRRAELEIRQGNCLGIVIQVTKGTDGKFIHTLWTFFADE